MTIDNRITMLIASKLRGIPLFGGDYGDILHDGFMSLDYVDIGASSGIDFSSPGILRPSPLVDTCSDPTSTQSVGTLTMFNRSFLLRNGKTVTRLGCYLVAAGTVVLKIASRVGSTYTVVWSQSFSHPGGGWAELSPGFAVPATGDYHVGWYVGAGSFPVVFDNPRAFVSGNLTAAGSLTENIGKVPPFRASYSGASSGVAQSRNIPASSVPDWMRGVLFVKGVETLNTDIIASFSRDDGATWSAATLTERFSQPDGTKVLDTGEVDVSGQPAGQLLKWRVAMTGSEIELHGVTMPVGEAT